MITVKTTITDSNGNTIVAVTYKRNEKDSAYRYTGLDGWEFIAKQVPVDLDRKDSKITNQQV